MRPLAVSVGRKKTLREVLEKEVGEKDVELRHALRPLKGEPVLASAPGAAGESQTLGTTFRRIDRLEEERSTQ